MEVGQEGGGHKGDRNPTKPAKGKVRICGGGLWPSRGEILFISVHQDISPKGKLGIIESVSKRDWQRKRLPGGRKGSDGA